MEKLPFLQNYSGQTVDELLALEGQFRTDSLLAALAQGVDDKAVRVGVQGLNEVECSVLAVWFLEVEVGHDGFSGFFNGYSGIYVPFVVDALLRIGCPQTANITQRAIDALNIQVLTPGALEEAVCNAIRIHDKQLDECDTQFYEYAEDLETRLFEFVQANKDAIRL